MGPACGDWATRISITTWSRNIFYRSAIRNNSSGRTAKKCLFDSIAYGTKYFGPTLYIPPRFLGAKLGSRLPVSRLKLGNALRMWSRVQRGTDTMNDQRLITVSEALAVLKISRSTFYRLRKSGDGPPIVKLGKRTLIREASLIAWIAKREASNG